MIKQLRAIIIIVVALIIIVAGAIFVSTTHLFKKSTSSVSSVASSDISLIKTDANNITKIKITNNTGSYDIIKTAKDTWNIDNVDANVINVSSLSSIATSASQLAATKIIEKNPADLSIYGLSTPAATVELTISDKVRTFLVGKETPLSDGYYLMEKGDSNVYITSTAVSTDFLNSELSFVNTALLTVDQTNDVPNISAVTFGGTARTTPINIIKSPTASSSSSSATSIAADYVITTPLSIDTGSDKMSTLTKALTSISADSCVSLDVSTASLQKYGLDKPKYAFSVTISKKSTTLLFGSTVTDSGTEYIYIMLSGRNAIYRIATSNVPFYNYKLIDLASPLQFIYMINTVKSITVQSGTNIWKFDLSGTDDALAIKCGSKTLTTKYFQNYYQTLIGISIEGETSAPQNPQLLCKVTFEFRDSAKSNAVSEFYMMNGSFSAWSINGKTNFDTLTSSINKLIDNTQKIANNQDVAVS
jgi:hypothetical protein